MPKSIRSLARGVQVIRALQAASPSSLRDLHRATKIPKPTLLRILHTLEQCGFTSRRLADGSYSLSASLGRVRKRSTRHDRLAEVAAPILDRLGKKVLWPSDLLVPARGHLKIVETNQPQSPFLIDVSRVGQP